MHADVLDPYNRIVQKTMDLSIPLMVHWELTYQCNLKCIHCYCTHQPDKQEYTTREIMDVIDELERMQSLYITFSGGEILCRDDFFDIAFHARSRGFALRLLTNGTCITDDIVERIKHINPLSVEMSVYASSAALHDSIVGVNGSFEKTIKAFKLLNDRGIRTKVKSLIMKNNAGEYIPLKNLAATLGSDFVYDMIVMQRDDGSAGPLRFRLDATEMAEIFGNDERVTSFEPHNEVLDDTFMCSAGMNNFMISPYGDVYPCVGMKERAGSLKRESLRAILDSMVMKNVRSTKFSELWACRECERAHYCRRCPGLASAEDGDYLGPSAAACTMAMALKDVINTGQKTGLAR